MSDPTKNDINTNWCTIKSIINNLLNDYVPYRTTKSRHNLPWITNEIKRSMRKQDRLFLRARKSNSNTDCSNFLIFRNSGAKSITLHINYINIMDPSLTPPKSGKSPSTPSWADASSSSQLLSRRPAPWGNQRSSFLMIWAADLLCDFRISARVISCSRECLWLFSGGTPSAFCNRTVIRNNIMCGVI